jgi:hypothetical protein
VFSETLLPFVPMCVEDDAKAITYNHMFHEAAWAIAGRDPDGQLRPQKTLKPSADAQPTSLAARPSGV